MIQSEVKKRKNNNKLLSITKYLVEKHKIIQPIKLQKILYFLYLEYLKKYNEKLFEEEFEAWIYGPVLPKVFAHIKYHGFNFSEIENTKSWNYIVISPLQDEQIISFIDEQIKKYSIYDSQKLIELSHETEPWKKARKGLSYNEISTKKIDFKDLKNYAKSPNFNR